MACQFLANPTFGAGRLSKFRVSLNLLLDTFGTLASCIFLFTIQGSHWGSNDDVQAMYWRTIIGVLIAGTVSSAVAQSFLLERFWKNIRHHRLGTGFAVTILVLTIITSVAAIVACAYLQWVNAPVTVPFVWIALIGNVIAALGITTVSVCQRWVRRAAGPPKKNAAIRATRAFIETGFPSTIIAILALVAWAAGREGDFVVALYFVQARVYSCIMLLALRNPYIEHPLEVMVSTSVVQRRVPVPPLSPEIYLNNAKSDRASLCEIPEGKEVQGWYDVDLSGAEARTGEDTSGQVPPLARNASFYQVPDEEKQ